MAFYKTWINQPESLQKTFFSVTVNSGESYYRLYIIVKGKIVIADENVGIHIYSFSASKSERVEIRGYSTSVFRIEFAEENPYDLLQSQMGTEISMTYEVL